jgi:hypothetical protein
VSEEKNRGDVGRKAGVDRVVEVADEDGEAARGRA